MLRATGDRCLQFDLGADRPLMGDFQKKTGFLGRLGLPRASLPARYDGGLNDPVVNRFCLATMPEAARL
jgi:hypothetical protein